MVDNGDTLKAADSPNYPLQQPKQAATPPDLGQGMLWFSPCTFFLSAAGRMCFSGFPTALKGKPWGSGFF